MHALKQVDIARLCRACLQKDLSNTLVQSVLVHLRHVEFVITQGGRQQRQNGIGLVRLVIATCASCFEELLLNLLKPSREEALEELRHEVRLVRLLLLDKVLEADEDRHRDFIRIHIIHLLDDVGVELLHDLLLELCAGHHQVSERVEALNAEIVAPNDRQLGQDRQDNRPELEVVVNEQLGVLHKRFNILLDRVRVFCLREGLDKDALTLCCLDLLDPIGVNIELLQKLQSLVWVAICRLQIIEQGLQRWHHGGACLDFFISLSTAIPTHRVSLRCIPFRRFRDGALHVNLLLVVVHLEVLGEAADNLRVNLRVLLEGVVLEVEDTEGLEFLQLPRKADDLHVGELNPVVAEDHLHDVEVVIALALQLKLCDVVCVQNQHLQLGHLTQDGHLLNEVVPQIKLLEPGQLQVHGADVVVAGNDMLEPLQLIQGIDSVQIVLGDVDLFKLCHSGHLLQVTKIL